MVKAVKPAPFHGAERLGGQAPGAWLERAEAPRPRLVEVREFRAPVVPRALVRPPPAARGDLVGAAEVEVVPRV